MSVKLQFIIICERAFLTAGSNNLNLIGMFSQINADRFPFSYPHFALVVNFDVSTAGNVSLHTDVAGPDGASLANTQMPVAVNPGNMQVIANFENLRFAEPGAYTISVTLDGRPLGTRVLQVKPVLTPAAGKTNIA